MSALPPKADIDWRYQNVCFVPKADIEGLRERFSDECRSARPVRKHRSSSIGPKSTRSKTKELIALGISVAIRCDDCIGFHVKAALKQGASREELTETLGMAVYMGAGPSVMYATHALDAFTQFESQDVLAF